MGLAALREGKTTTQAVDHIPSHSWDAATHETSTAWRPTSVRLWAGQTLGAKTSPHTKRWRSWGFGMESPRIQGPAFSESRRPVSTSCDDLRPSASRSDQGAEIVASQIYGGLPVHWIPATSNAPVKRECSISAEALGAAEDERGPQQQVPGICTLAPGAPLGRRPGRLESVTTRSGPCRSRLSRRWPPPARGIRWSGHLSCRVRGSLPGSSTRSSETCALPRAPPHPRPCGCAA